jgi:hypothetical protein
MLLCLSITFSHLHCKKVFYGLRYSPLEAASRAVEPVLPVPHAEEKRKGRGKGGIVRIERISMKGKVWCGQEEKQTQDREEGKEGRGRGGVGPSLRERESRENKRGGDKSGRGKARWNMSDRESLY